MNRVSKEDCFGYYPESECDRQSCKDMCPDIESCKKRTESGDGKA